MPWTGVLSGFEKFLNWFPEVTFGTPDTAATFRTFGIEADFESEVTQGRFPLAGLHSRDPRTIRVGNREVGMRVSCAMHDTELFKAVLGTSDDLWSGSISARDHLPSLSVETIERAQGAVIGVGELYGGGKVNDYRLEARAGQWLRQSFDLFFQEVSEMAADTISIPNPPSQRTHTYKGAAVNLTQGFDVSPSVEPFMAFDGGLKYAYAASGTTPAGGSFIDPDAQSPIRTVTDWSLHVGNSLKRRHGVRNDGNRFLNELVEGERIVELEVVSDFRDMEHYRRFLKDSASEFLYAKLRIPESTPKFITLNNGKWMSSTRPQSANDLIALRSRVQFKKDDATGLLPISVGTS